MFPPPPPPDVKQRNSLLKVHSKKVGAGPSKENGSRASKGKGKVHSLEIEAGSSRKRAEEPVFSFLIGSIMYIQ